MYNWPQLANRLKTADLCLNHSRSLFFINGWVIGSIGKLEPIVVVRVLFRGGETAAMAIEVKVTVLAIIFDLFW